jgi:hypothetical protein
MAGNTTDQKSGDHVRVGTDSDWEGLSVLKDYGFMTGCVAKKGGNLVYAGYEIYGRIGGTTSTYVTSPTVVSAGTIASNNVWGMSDNQRRRTDSVRLFLFNLITMAQYTINISSQAELEEHWSDSSCPNFGFCFDQQTLKECTQIDGNTWTATYNSMEVSSPKTYTYLDMVNGGSITYTLEPGEYGIKP